jgi:hypothetical protein
VSKPMGKQPTNTAEIRAFHAGSTPPVGVTILKNSFQYGDEI